MNEPSVRVAALEGLELLQFPALREAGVPHGFTLRTGGFGARGRGEADRQKLAPALGLSRLASMRQVHGNEIRVLEANGAHGGERCDGLLSNQNGVGLVVESADCVPLLFWAPKARAAAAVHAGWRGTLARIAARAVSSLHDVYRAESDDLVVAIGPAIRVCCYEVGDEVIAAFSEGGCDVDRISRPGPRGRRHLDLAEENRSQLAASGVSLERVYDSDVCTRCQSDRFYSFRREGVGVGRIFGVIGLL